MKLKLKKSVFFVNFSPEAIAYLVQKALLTCKIVPKQVECFFGDARNSCRQRQTRTFWVTWPEAVK